MSGRSMRTMLAATALATAGMALTSPTTTYAQEGESDKAAELISVVKTRPSGMDRDQWREARRDAARELGSLGVVSSAMGTQALELQEVGKGAGLLQLMKLESGGRKDLCLALERQASSGEHSESMSQVDDLR